VDGPTDFFAHVLAKCQDKDWYPGDALSAGSMVDLACRMWGNDTNLSALMVRECYPEYLGYVMACTELSTSVIVGGSKGIGKSFFGLYMCVRVLQQGWVVIYEFKKTRTLLVPRTASDEALALVNEKLELLNCQRVEKGNTYSFLERDIDEFSRVVELRCLFYIVDVDEASFEGHVLCTGNARRVIITSPNTEKIKRLHEAMAVAHVFLPSWSWDEMEALNSSAFLVNAPPGSVVCTKPEQELRRLFDLYRGIPRHVLRRNNADDVLKGAIANLNLDVLKKVFKSGYGQIPKLGEGMGSLVRIEPVTFLDASLPKTFENASKFKAVVASDGVLDLLGNAYKRLSRAENMALFIAVQGIPAFAAFRGYFLDEHAHEALVTERTVLLQQLWPLDANYELERKAWPKMTTQAFDRMDMRDLPFMASGVYARPRFINFPSVDSFAVMPRNVFEPDVAGEVLVMFQVTVATTHKERGPDIDDVRRKVCGLMGIDDVDSLPLFLVFVTTRTGIREAQPILTGEGKAYVNVPMYVQKMKQFTLLLGKEFEDLDSCLPRDYST
jgi:hypothetical protein